MKTIKKPTPRIIAFKGFNPGYECRGFKYKVGQTYKADGDVKLCGNGFHACEYPLDVLQYYESTKSVFAQVEQSGAIAKEKNGGKQASSVITIKAALSLQGLIHAAVEYTFARVKKTGRKSNSGDYGAASNSGDYGAASNSGYGGVASNSGARGAASNSGARGAASNSGDYGAASTSGARGAASNSGYGGAAESNGKQGTAMAAGGGPSRVRGAEGNALFLVERDDNGDIVRVWAGVAGHNGIKADTWYALRNGQLVEA